MKNASVIFHCLIFSKRFRWLRVEREREKVVVVEGSNINHSLFSLFSAAAAAAAEEEAMRHRQWKKDGKISREKEAKERKKAKKWQKRG
jgi:hypothetical protein